MPTTVTTATLPETGEKTMRHILSVLIENEAGALSRVTGLFSARGYNIDSLTVQTTCTGL